ncbi:hypothetical protein C2857_000028 [Epichloe festucae Fl1]|uniref:Uncharacterized protein n=1 Tax=Epichloe festucae (strain Fl1) TaxID=877507 RepID=A0A7S9KJL6_EPIFF|nr:hypothetical protein C2857_000028 [Epichloe festucae Fl1]
MRFILWVSAIASVAFAAPAKRVDECCDSFITPRNPLDNDPYYKPGGCTCYSGYY